MFSRILFNTRYAIAVYLVGVGRVARKNLWLFGLALGLFAPASFALPPIAETAICAVINDAKIILGVGLILAGIFGVIAAQMRSDKIQEIVLGVIVSIAALFAIVYAIKGSNWANSLTCVASF
jgi:small-conductance mechanosensitive channel